MSDLQTAARALIENVMERYNLKSAEEFECPHFRALAAALADSYDDGK